MFLTKYHRGSLSPSTIKATSFLPTLDNIATTLFLPLIVLSLSRRAMNGLKEVSSRHSTYLRRIDSSIISSESIRSPKREVVSLEMQKECSHPSLSLTTVLMSDRSLSSAIIDDILRNLLRSL